jgi:hypothetical protein
MPDGAGGSHPDPEEIDRKLRKLTEEIGKPRIHEPSALERMVAARQAEKKAQRKRDRYGLTGWPASQAAPRSYSRSTSGPRRPGMSGFTG